VLVPVSPRSLHTQEEGEVAVAVAMAPYSLSRHLKEVIRGEAARARQGVAPERTQAGDAPVEEGSRNSIPVTVEVRVGLVPDR
jgi:hypothetical protein